MKRKIIKQGHDTLTITLPKNWCKENEINGGDEINVEEFNKNLVVSTKSSHEVEHSIEVDMSNLDRSSIQLWIQGLYRFGFDRVRIKVKDPIVPHFRLRKNTTVSEVIHETTQRLIGSEIVSSSPTSFLIKKISKESNEEFSLILRRIFRLINDMFGVFIKGIETNDRSILESIEFHHINLKRFINYCLRLLNKFSHAEIKKTSFYFAIVQYLSKTEDMLKNASRYILKNNYRMSRKGVQVVKLIKDSFDKYYDFFYDYKPPKIKAVMEHRDKVRFDFLGKVKDYSKDEIVILAGLMQIIELLLDMTELRMALEN